MQNITLLQRFNKIRDYYQEIYSLFIDALTNEEKAQLNKLLDKLEKVNEEHINVLNERKEKLLFKIQETVYEERDMQALRNIIFKIFNEKELTMLEKTIDYLIKHNAKYLIYVCYGDCDIRVRIELIFTDLSATDYDKIYERIKHVREDIMQQTGVNILESELFILSYAYNY